MLWATVSCGQPCAACQITYGEARATAMTTPAAVHHDRSGHRGPTTRSVARTTTATNPTWGLASLPIPTTTPAARTHAPLSRTIARTISHTSRVVLSRSKVVVETMCPTASANPDDAVHPAAITWARRPPPTSLATSAASTAVAAVTSADGSRRTTSDPGTRWFIAQLRSGTSEGWSG